MAEIITYDNTKKEIEERNTSLSDLTEDLLLDARNTLLSKKAVSVPIAQLSTLGAGVSTLIPALRTITKTTSVDTQGLFRLANVSVDDTLKAAKNGNYWGAFKTVEGKSKMVQLEAAGPISVDTSMIMPINPATMMMAVALYSIEQKLGRIEEMEGQILSFLETEKQSEIEADVETLSSIFSKYKYNWDNEHFVTSNHKLVLDIQKTAIKNMLSYQKKISEALQSQNPITLQAQVDSTLKNLLNSFNYYRLSLYDYGLASFLEIMLSGNFKEEYISIIRDDIEKHSFEYRDLFNKGSEYLERISKSSIETTVIKGLGDITKGLGKFIGGIPLIKDGPVDEFLVQSGKDINRTGQKNERNVLNSFAALSSPATGFFTDKMNEMIQIYNHTKEICFDKENIYLIA